MLRGGIAIPSAPLLSAEETLHAPAVEVMQGPRVRRRPSKDDRRVVRQGDGSYRSREALIAARNARARSRKVGPPDLRLFTTEVSGFRDTSLRFGTALI